MHPSTVAQMVYNGVSTLKRPHGRVECLKGWLVVSRGALGSQLVGQG